MQPGYQSGPPQIDTNMTMSIVAIFLFWPLAIPAIVSAARAGQAMQRGDQLEAQVAAAESRKWSRLALIIGLIGYGILLVCCVLQRLT